MSCEKNHYAIDEEFNKYNQVLHIGMDVTVKLTLHCVWIIQKTS